MNLLVVSIYLLVLLNTCNHAFGEYLDCDCAPTFYVFDVFFNRGCGTNITENLSGINNDSINKTGVLCNVTGLQYIPDNTRDGGYAYNATIRNVGNVANSFEVSKESFPNGADSFEISFYGPFGGSAQPEKVNYSSGLQVELNIFQTQFSNDVVRRMDVFIPYTGQCDQIVFSHGDRIAWLTFNGTASDGPLDQTCTSSQAPSLVPTEAPTIKSCKGKGSSKNGCTKSEKKIYKSAKSMKNADSKKSAKSVKSVKSAKSAYSVKSVKSTKSVKSVKSAKSAYSVKSVKSTKSAKSAYSVKSVKGGKSTKIVSAKGKGT